MCAFGDPALTHDFKWRHFRGEIILWAVRWRWESATHVVRERDGILLPAEGRSRAGRVSGPAPRPLNVGVLKDGTWRDGMLGAPATGGGRCGAAQPVLRRFGTNAFCIAGLPPLASLLPGPGQEDRHLGKRLPRRLVVKAFLAQAGHGHARILQRLDVRSQVVSPSEGDQHAVRAQPQLP